MTQSPLPKVRETLPGKRGVPHNPEGVESINANGKMKLYAGAWATQLCGAYIWFVCYEPGHVAHRSTAPKEHPVYSQHRFSLPPGTEGASCNNPSGPQVNWRLPSAGRRFSRSPAAGRLRSGIPLSIILMHLCLASRQINPEAQDSGYLSCIELPGSGG